MTLLLKMKYMEIRGCRHVRQPREYAIFSYQPKNIARFGLLSTQDRLAVSIFACLHKEAFSEESLFCFERVLVGLDHLLRRDTRTTFTPCMELFQPFFRVFACKYLDF